MWPRCSVTWCDLIKAVCCRKQQRTYLQRETNRGCGMPFQLCCGIITDGLCHKSCIWSWIRLSLRLSLEISCLCTCGNWALASLFFIFILSRSIWELHLPSQFSTCLYVMKWWVISMRLASDWQQKQMLSTCGWFKCSCKQRSDAINVVNISRPVSL